MKVQLIQSPEGAPNICFGVYDMEGPEGCVYFVQSDWDYAGLASRLGWVPCDCGETDGTVPCKHKTTGEMLASAYDWLSEHDGEEFEWNE